MKKSGQCPKCGSTEIIAGAMGTGGQFPMALVTYRDPSALILKGQQKSTVSAWVCSACAYVEFYADDAAALKLPKTETAS